jgi:hypothetical protein
LSQKGKIVEKQDLTPTGMAGMSSYEIISIYMNHGYDGSPEAREALEAELRRRKLPVPEETMPRAHTPRAAAPGKNAAMSQETFLAYLLLIYTVSGLFYAWLYLPMRLIRGDFGRDRRHKLIQTGIAFAYQALEIAAYLALD